MAAAKTEGAGVTLTFTEMKGDLFSSSSSASLAHCVSQDLRMGKGIATIFKKKFEGVEELKAQGVRVGGCALLKRDERYIFYLVTKPKYFHKPSYSMLTSSLRSLREQVEELGIKELCMPRIGCGLDGLEWGRVKEIICDVFQDLELSVTVYYL